MQEQAGDTRPLPPVSTQFGGARGLPVDGDVRPVRPVVGEPTLPRAVPAPAAVAELAEPASETDVSRQQPPAPEAQAASEREFSWEMLTEEGTAEPVFEADVEDTQAALTAIENSAQPEAEPFPLDAFIIPEQAAHVPAGLEDLATPTPAVHTPATDIADRLEKLSHRLRLEEAEAVIGQLAGGDRLDAMLAGLLAGYMAAQK